MRYAPRSSVRWLRNFHNRPVRAFKRNGAIFLGGAATPPCKGGEYSSGDALSSRYVGGPFPSLDYDVQDELAYGTRQIHRSVSNLLPARNPSRHDGRGDLAALLLWRDGRLFRPRPRLRSDERFFV